MLQYEKVANEAGLPFEAVTLDGMQQADVIISITSAFAPSLWRTMFRLDVTLLVWEPIPKANKRCRPDRQRHSVHRRVAQSISIKTARYRRWPNNTQ